jgi:hypothetical protein
VFHGDADADDTEAEGKESRMTDPCYAELWRAALELERQGHSPDDIVDAAFKVAVMGAHRIGPEAVSSALRKHTPELFEAEEENADARLTRH